MPRFGSAVSSYGVGKTMTPPVYGGFSGGLSSALGGNLLGSSGGKSGCTGCEPNVPFVTTLIEFVQILETFKSSIDKFFPSMRIGAPIGAKFGAHGTMDVRLYARLEWVRRYKDTYGKFDPTNVLYINQLKEIFLSLGYDWRIDKWLVEWKPPATGPLNGGTGDPTRSVSVVAP